MVIRILVHLNPSVFLCLCVNSYSLLNLFTPLCISVFHWCFIYVFFWQTNSHTDDICLWYCSLLPKTALLSIAWRTCYWFCSVDRREFGFVDLQQTNCCLYFLVSLSDRKLGKHDFGSQDSKGISWNQH